MIFNKKILVALSGGLDSSVASLLLKREKWKVEGVHFLFPLVTDLKSSFSFSQEALKKSEEIASKLGIKLHIVDVRQIFFEEVITDFIKRSKKGETPNPCVVCNEKVKFKALLDLASSLKISKVATGHYARKLQKTVKDSSGKTRSKWFIKKSKDIAKDQSYFLCLLSNSVIEKCEFPLGDYSREEVRLIAKKSALPNFSKEESSQGLCFLKGPIDNFLEENVIEESGEIVNQKGNVIGKHEGLAKYTLGQRRGIKIGGSGPYFTIGKDYNKNELRVSNIGDDPELFKSEITVSVNSSNKKRFLFLEKASSFAKKEKNNFYLKIRYGQKEVAVQEIKFLSSELMKVKLKSEIRAVTPGQIAVLYDQEGVLVLGGTIK
jgi:tRNA-uridine 2-sulfurtransferase